MADEQPDLPQRYTPKAGKVLEAKPQVCTARFSPCGKYLVAGGFDSQLHRWDLAQQELPELPAVAGHDGWISDVAFLATDKLLISVDSWGQLRCSSVDDPAQVKWSQPEAHNGWIQSVAVSPDQKQVATCGNDGVVRLWSAADGQKQHDFPVQQPVFRVLFHPNSDSVLAGDLLGKVRQWNVTTGELIREFDAGQLFKVDRLQDTGGVRSLAISSDGQWLAVGGTKPANGGNVQGIPTALVYEMASGELKHTLEMGATGDVYISDMQFHPAGFLMATISGNPGVGKLLFRQLGEEKPFVSLTNIANCHSLSLHPDGHRLAVTGTNTGSNGNGRQLDANGDYRDNFSPIHLLEFPA